MNFILKQAKLSKCYSLSTLHLSPTQVRHVNKWLFMDGIRPLGSIYLIGYSVFGTNKS
jgi:hypothetical protein